MIQASHVFQTKAASPRFGHRGALAKIDSGRAASRCFLLFIVRTPWPWLQNGRSTLAVRRSVQAPRPFSHPTALNFQVGVLYSTSKQQHSCRHLANQKEERAIHNHRLRRIEDDGGSGHHDTSCGCRGLGTLLSHFNHSLVKYRRQIQLRVIGHALKLASPIEHAGHAKGRSQLGLQVMDAKLQLETRELQGHMRPLQLLQHFSQGLHSSRVT
mmetsp:Transcript_41504/g.110066  ORF Transcript_41504/g.110066 Transcript_41504/m.110066 type:complete len:213 (+) Transcript_41504:19-657(+)